MSDRTCTVETCDRKHRALGLCHAHYERRRKTGDVRPGDPIGGRRPFRTDNPGYRTVHQRLVTRRGAAPEHDCADCGGQAEHWTYDYSDPDELLCETQGSPYSTDLDRYDPRCHPCHKKFDNDWSDR